MRKNEHKYLERITKLKCDARDIQKMIDKYQRQKQKVLDKIAEWEKED